MSNTTLKCSLFFFACLYLSACGEEKTTKNTTNNELVAENIQAETPKESKPQMEQEIQLIKPKDTEVIAQEETKESIEAEEIGWEALMPADYNPYEIMNEYIVKLNELEDSDVEALEIYGEMQAELDNAPVNMAIDGKTIKMPGFIAPLENKNGIIDQFLLVPFYGACIHVPPPPINQTVLVKAEKGEGVKSEDSSFPVWITGKLVVAEEKTNIGAAGYRIENPSIEPYIEE